MQKERLSFSAWLSSFLRAVLGLPSVPPPPPPPPAPCAARPPGADGRSPLDDPEIAACYLLIGLLGVCLMWFMHMLFDRRATLLEFIRRIDLIIFNLPVLSYFFFRVPYAMLFESKEGALHLKSLVFERLMPPLDEARQRLTLRLLRAGCLTLILGGIFLSAIPTRFEMEFEQAMALVYAGQTEAASARVNSLWTSRHNLASYFLREDSLVAYERRLKALAEAAIRAENTDREFQTGREVWQPQADTLASWRADFGREQFHALVLSSFIQQHLKESRAALLEIQNALRMADTPLRRAEAGLVCARAYLGDGDLGLAQIQIARVLERSGIEGDRPFTWSTLMHYFRRYVCQDGSYSLEGLPFEWRARNTYAIVQAVGQNYTAAESGWEGILRDGVPAPHRPRILSNLGELAVVKERWAEAESRLREALREDPLWLPAQLNLCDMYGLRRNYVQAEQIQLTLKSQFAGVTRQQKDGQPVMDSRLELALLHGLWLRLREDATSAAGPSATGAIEYSRGKAGRLDRLIAQAATIPSLHPYVEAIPEELQRADIPGPPRHGKPGRAADQAGSDAYARLLLGISQRCQRISIGYGSDILPREFAVAASYEAVSAEMRSEVHSVLDRLPPPQISAPELVLRELDT